MSVRKMIVFNPTKYFKEYDKQFDIWIHKIMKIDHYKGSAKDFINRTDLQGNHFDFYGFFDMRVSPKEVLKLISHTFRSSER
jgi:hypothetical protein